MWISYPQFIHMQRCDVSAQYIKALYPFFYPIYVDNYPHLSTMAVDKLSTYIFVDLVYAQVIHRLPLIYPPFIHTKIIFQKVFEGLWITL